MGKQVFCDICSCYIPSASLLEGHKQGKKHRRLASKKESKERSLECSIYVRGFKKSATIEKELENIFQKYGKIYGLFLDKTTLSYAIIQFEGKETVAQVLSSNEDLYIDGKKLVIKERTNGSKERNVNSQSPCPKPHEDQDPSSNPQRDLQSENLMKALREENTLTNQMRRLVKETMLNAEDIKLRELICLLLSEVFIEIHADAVVHVFGSSACGIGIKGSDVDATLITSDLANYIHQGPHNLVNPIAFGGHSGSCLSQAEHKTCSSTDGQKGKLAFEKDLVVDHADGESDLKVDVSGTLHSSCPSPANDCLPFTLHSSDSANGKSHVSAASGGPTVDEEINTITNVLRKFAPGCKNIFALKTAHCPLISFVHKDSGLKVDLSINNRLALQNTMLVKRYIELDERVKPLIFTVKAWARTKGLYGKGGKQLTGYAWTLLVLHFLQRHNPPVLPCLQETDAVNVSSNVVLGWECSYSQNLVWKSPNEESEGALLVSFFKYFMDYNFDNQTVIISSLRKAPKNSLEANWRSHGIESFKLTPLCLQDPFELTHNVAHNMSSAGLDRFKEELSKAYDNSLHYMELCTSNCDVSTDGISRKGLPDLLDVQPEAPQNKRNRRKRLAVKYIFDIKTPNHVTYLSCAHAAREILEVDLRMQCERTRNVKDSEMPGEEAEKEEDSPSFRPFSDNDESIMVPVEPPGRSTETVAVGSHCVTSDTMTNLWKPQAKRAKWDNTVDCSSPTFQNLSENGGDERTDIVESKSSTSSETVDDVTAASKSIVRSQDPSFIIQGSPSKFSQDGQNSLSLDTVSHVYPPEGLHSANEDRGPGIDAIEIVAKAWANTWVKRRQQRRLHLDQGTFAGSQLSIKDQEGSSEQSINLSGSSLKDSCSVLSVSSNQSGSERKSINAMQCGGNVEDRWTKSSNGPVLSVSVKIVNMEDRKTEYSSRVIVKLLYARDLNIFHTFYAFFKKRLLSKLNLKGDAVLSSMKR